MTRTTPDWLLELRNARGAGIDAIALFRGAECYTDGVTEAESAAGHPFSEERLLRVGAENCGQSVEDLLRSVQRELATSAMACRSPTIARLLQFAAGYDRDCVDLSASCCTRLTISKIFSVAANSAKLIRALPARYN
jgi:hypothetical protein